MKRRYDKQEIAQLLGKFMEGTTNLNEEQVLAQYFRTHEVGEEWKEYKEMFALFDSGEVEVSYNPPVGDEQAGNQTMPPAQGLRGTNPLWSWLWAAAACILLLLVFYFDREVSEEASVMAKVEEQVSPLPVPSPSVEEKQEETLAEVLPKSKPAKKRRKTVRQPSPEIEPAPEPMYAQTEQPSATQYQTIHTVHLSSDVVVHVIEASDVPTAPTAPSVSELRARGLRLMSHVQQASQTTVPF